MLTLAAGPQSNSHFPAFSPIEIFSSVTERVSDIAVEVDRIRSHGLPSAGRDVCSGGSTLSVGVEGSE